MFDGPRNWEVLFRLARSLSKSSKPEVIRAQLLKFSWHGIKAHGPEFSENKLYGLIAAASSMIQKGKDLNSIACFGNNLLQAFKWSL